MTKLSRNVIISVSSEREVNTMALMYTDKEAFERVKKFLEVNQYSFEFVISDGTFLIKITE